MENQTLNVFKCEEDFSDEDESIGEDEDSPVLSYDELEDTKFDFSSEYASESDAVILVSSEEYEARRVEFGQHVKKVLALEQRKRVLDEVASRAGAIDIEDLTSIQGTLQKENYRMIAKGKLLDTLRVDEEQRGSAETQANVKPEWSKLFSGLNRHRDKAGTTPAEFYQHKANIISSLKTIYEPKEPTPSGDQFAEQSSLLLVGLMKHQKCGLRWMQFRERQEISGGILADDMGLGKTLSMISLILSSLEKKKLKMEKRQKAQAAKWMPFKKLYKFNIFEDEFSEEEDEEPTPPKRLCPELSQAEELTESEEEDDCGPYPHAGTLVVCPMSVMCQWAQEVSTKVAPNTINFLIFHGAYRQNISLEMFRRHDLVITSYQTVASEVGKLGNSSLLLAVQWQRLILDEAHIIRNTKTKCFNSVYLLRAHCRWALTGTPVQNRAIDVFALLRFLNVPHFNHLNTWKTMLNHGKQAHFRLSFIIKPLMLRRTKQQLQASGDMPALPELMVEVVHVQLSEPEMAVYQILSSISQKIFTQFLMQRERGNNDLNYSSLQGQPQFITNHVEEKYTKIYERFLRSLGYNPKEKVKGIVILVLLLRLRQFCCHPSLMVNMFLFMDAAMPHSDLKLDLKHIGGSLQLDALKELENYAARDCSSDGEEKKVEIKTEDPMQPVEEDFGAQLEMETNTEEVKPKEENVLSDLAGAMELLNINNPIFNPSQPSAKLKAVIQRLESILEETNDKVIVVATWTSFLSIIRDYLHERDWKTLDFNGQLNAKEREEVLREFNMVLNDKRVLLLSLTAGGVGLNLNVANHLLLVDLHWNPQLQRQAQDRIYRYGQQKQTFIYRFMCRDTMEQRINALQEYKLEIANVVLQPDQSALSSAGGRLSLEDLKKLFLNGVEA
ncbi:transcription termination factor 2 [Drosophila guanche]|uniref:Blast:Transcription termination factor 2 n=1 Tax=Drosophila guanche TaxID=7266 RepID=A0A3B0K525_DROGU|nr:transcription termination factor 2 [Drosophila guanche]SPP83110.1 blast:Transcription termination factor 2 [Drosophila guanche]